MYKNELALLALIIAMGAGWVHDYRVGSYFKDRSRKLSKVGIMLMNEMDRNGVELDDFTLIVLNEIISDETRTKNMHLSETVQSRERNPAMSETNPTPETNNVTELPAPKQKRFTNPFKKNDTVPTDATETPVAKTGVPRGVWLAGVGLLITGVVIAAVKSADDLEDDKVEETESEDTTETD